TDVEMLQLITFAPQVDDELPHQTESIAEGRQIGDLATDVHVNAGDLDARQPCRLGVEAGGVKIGNAELVFGLARRNLRVRAGVNIGVDANGNPRSLALFAGDLAQRFELRLALDIEAKHAFLDRVAQLG